MAIRGPRLEFSVGAFLLLALASLLVLAVASTNQRWGTGGSGYELKARFTQIGQLRKQAPVKIGGVTIGQVSGIELDPADTSAGIFTSGLLGESYIGLQPGGDPDVLKSGDEIVFTQPAVDLLQLVGKYMFSGPANTGGADSHDGNGAPAPATEPQP